MEFIYVDITSLLVIVMVVLCAIELGLSFRYEKRIKELERVIDELIQTKDR